MILQYLEHDSSNIRRSRERVFQQLPYPRWNSSIVGIRPETVSPRSARDMDLHHSIERHSIDHLEYRTPVIDGVTVNVVQIEQDETPAALRNRTQQACIIPNFGIGW
jgi:hypothetical protein